MTRIVQSACAAVLVVLLLACVGLAAEVSNRISDVGDLTRDPTAVAGVPWWTGGLSRITNLCWAAAAALNALASRAAPASHRWPLLSLGALCAVLAVDDTMLVHESIMPGRGVPEEVLLVSYAVAGLVVAGLWLSRTWSRGVLVAFLTGAAALAGSVAADVIHTLPFLLEDGAKLAGILAWCFCGVWAHADLLAAGQREARPEPVAP